MQLKAALSKKNLYNLFILILFAAPVITVFVQTRLDNNLDPSYMFSVNYAASHHLVFGNDIIITYGPLGCLAYTVTEGLSPWLVVFSVLMKIIYLVIFYFLLIEVADKVTRNQSKFLTIITKYILFPWLVYKIGTFAEYSIIIFLGLIYCCILNITNDAGSPFAAFFSRRKSLLAALTGFTTALLFFIKVSLLPFILAVPIIILIKFYSAKRIKNLLFFSGAMMVTFFLFYALFNINLRDYLFNSLEVIAGYKKAMQMFDYDDYQRYFVISITLILFFTAQLMYMEPFPFFKKNFLTLSLLFLGIYFLFTYSFTRGYKGGFIFNPSFIVFFFYFITCLISNAKLNFRINCIIIFTLFIGFYDFAYPFNIIKLLNPPAKEYIYYKNIPEKFLNRSETYDVYPYLTTLCYFNNLNYKSRPTVQSYTCYTTKLDSLTARFFEQKKVDNVIFHGTTSNGHLLFGRGNTMDFRYFLFEEPLTKIAILKNYCIKNQVNDSLFIASKRPKGIDLNLKLIEDTSLKLNGVYNLKSDSGNLYFFTAGFNYTTKAKLVAQVKKYPHIKIDICLTSGKKWTFDVISDLLKKPCVLNKYCDNYNDFFDIADAQKLSALKNVKSIKFYSNTGDGYENEIKFKVYQCSLK